MPSYIARIDVNEDEFQNPQELVSVWGTIREDIEGLGGEILQTYVVLGDYDFHLAFEVESGETAFQVSQAIERHGLDTNTMRTLPLERIGELVDDI
ncbi:GYD domain-containing protein [Halococcus agarilyticus]|uniref:GYD domain-containing protein n=1 Tax=Halococcus agarilyticus TaxID=1232219 RepID=UPI0006777A42|nr:GYD domain-containing protein [Halococcus agarilyticus]